MKRTIGRIWYDGEEYQEGTARIWENYGKKRAYINEIEDGAYIDIKEPWTLNGIEERTTEDGYVLFEKALNGKDVKVEIFYEVMIDEETTAAITYKSGESYKEKNEKARNLEDEKPENKENEEFEINYATKNILFVRKGKEKIAILERPGEYKVLEETFDSKEKAIERAKEMIREGR